MFATKRLYFLCFHSLLGCVLIWAPVPLLAQSEEQDAIANVSLLDLSVFSNKPFEYQLNFLPRGSVLPELVQIDVDDNGAVSGCYVKYKKGVSYDHLRKSIRSKFRDFEHSYDAKGKKDGLEFWNPVSPNVLISIGTDNSDGNHHVLYIFKESQTNQSTNGTRPAK